MSSGLDHAERFLGGAEFDRAPWLAVAFAAGIAAWFALPLRWQWLAFLLGSAGAAAAALAVLRADGRWPIVRQSAAALALMAAAGCGLVWAKSELAGTPPLTQPTAGVFAGIVLAREEQPAEGRVRLLLAIREPAAAPAAPPRVVKVRINVPLRHDNPAATEGAMVRLTARLMPPAPPLLPGGYDFARAAWFSGIAATGSGLGPVTVMAPAVRGGALAPVRRSLSAHIHAQVPGSAGGIAAAFASGDRGGIAAADEQAMRDSGLTHLLSVSGLHVSAVIGAVYLLTLRLLALWPWLALRVRLPLAAAGCAALAGIGYTLLTGAEVPTVRSVVGALLVLTAVALGREALSLRLLAVAGLAVMLLWPEAVIGPSFQLSFGAVLAIVALHGTGWMRRFGAARPEPWWLGMARKVAVLLLTGVVIELALMPIGLFHFHRAGVYGAVANVIAIPLTTFVTMPLIALALLLDLAGLGGPAWWAAQVSVDLLLGLARFVAGRPGAVTLWPAMGGGSYLLFVAGGLWLALWQRRARLWGLLPLALGAASLAALRPPDVLVSADGRHVGFTGIVPDTLVVLRETRSEFARERLIEMAGMDGELMPLEHWPGARCNADFCTLTVTRGGRAWRFLLARGTDSVPLRDLAAACERVDVVVADRWLPRSCHPAVLKADRALLRQTGGIALDLARARLTTVAQGEGEHGWWRPPPPPAYGVRPGPPIPPAPQQSAPASASLSPKAAVTPDPAAGESRDSARRVLQPVPHSPTKVSSQDNSKHE